VNQSPPANGYILGELASTTAGIITLYFSGGITNKMPAAGAHPTTNPVKTGSSKDGLEIFTVFRAGDLEFKYIRQPTIARNAAGQAIAMLKSDSTTNPVQVGNTYTGYCVAPRFDGQGVACNVEGVSMYSAFQVQNMTKPNPEGTFGFAEFNVYLMKDASVFDSDPAYVLTTYWTCSAGAETQAFALRTSADNAGVAHGNMTGGGKITLTVAKGMDAGLAVLAGFAPALLVSEIKSKDVGGPVGMAF
jgi:hypothetical protein